MKTRVLSLMCLFTLGASLCSPAFSQVVFTKKRAAQPPIATPQIEAPQAPQPEIPQARISPTATGTTIADASAFTDGANGVVVKWTTAIEIGNAGFNLYRLDRAGNKQLVNDSLIGGSMMRRSPRFPESTGAPYTLYDPKGSPDSTYFIEIMALGGNRANYGPVSPLRLKDITEKIGFDPQANPEMARMNGGNLQNITSLESYKQKSSYTPEADPVKQKWVAAQPGVKFKVRDTGLYRVSRAQLETAGFNTAAPQELWQLYVDGEEQRLNIDPSGNFIEFFGKGVDNQNSDSRFYYMVVGTTPGIRIGTTFRRPFGFFVLGQSFRSVASLDERINYVGSIMNGDGDNWWGAVISPSAPATRNVLLKDADTSRQKAIVTVNLHGYLNGLHRVQAKINGNMMGIMEFDGINPYSKTFSIAAANLVNGNNAFEFTSLNGALDYSLVKSINVEYARFYRAAQNRLTFDTQQLQSTTITGFDTSNIRVYDMALVDDPLWITNTTTAPGQNGFDVSIPSGRGNAMYAVSDNGLLSPLAITANTPSQLSASASNAHMLIISHANFMSGANDWANYRRGQGLNVDVVNVEDVFDEFDYGLPTPEAIKGFLAYGHTNYPNLKYVMLVGDATYDPRNYLNQGYNDFVPTKFINTNYGESPSDEWLGDFNDNGIAELAIGRLPVRTNAPVTLMLGKVTAFEGNLTNSLASRGVLFASDEPNGYPFGQVSRILADQLPVGTPVMFVDVDEDPDITIVRQRLINGINGGRLIVNYTGHGSTGVWSTKQLFRNIDVPLLTNNNGNLSMFFMLTCLNGFFVDPSNDSLSELLIKSPVGGASVSWASTGSTTPDIQQIMATKFFQIIGAGTYERLGDATVAAKQDAPSTDVPLTWNILGDPATKIK